ncbi:MAG: SRPBCC family protein [Scytolyngbya sp. HA4215-MV1]|nr:SRPBCC family protein [Scytolyngbya sp. HA4215-MV1]
MWQPPHSDTSLLNNQPLIIQGSSKSPSKNFTLAEAISANPLVTLPDLEQLTLQQGQPVVTGKDGNYTARILIHASPSQVWSVLTDYAHYFRFMPDMPVSKVLEINGNQYLLEQVDRYHIALLTFTARTRLRITETPESGYSFSMVEGKLKTLQGAWTLQPITVNSDSSKNQVLLTLIVEAQPKSASAQGMFYQLFRARLKAKLKAINAEVNQRNF